MPGASIAFAVRSHSYSITPPINTNAIAIFCVSKHLITMLALRSSRLSRGRPYSPAHTKQKEEPRILFYPAYYSGYYSSSPTSSTSCETSLDSSAYMDMDETINHVELCPSIESTSSISQPYTKLMQESVLKTNKYCGSAYVKARKQRHEMKDVLEYDDPPLDHLRLFTIESESSSCQLSKLVKEATLKIKQRHSVSEVVTPLSEATSPPPPLPDVTSSPWPQSSWRTGLSKTNATSSTKLPASVKKYLQETYDGPNPNATNSTSVRDIIVNNIKAKSKELDVKPVSITHTTRANSSDTAKSLKDRHISKVKAMARSRRERNDKKSQEHQNDQPKSTKSSKTFKDFVDHLLMVNATNQLCRSPESTPSPSQKGTLPSVDTVASKKRVSWQGVDPDLPKPILKRRSNSPDPPIEHTSPKPLLKRPHHLTQRFSSRPISEAPYDEDPMFSSPGGWKSVFLCGGSTVKVLHSP
jgi:hypothetical protein